MRLALAILFSMTLGARAELVKACWHAGVAPTNVPVLGYRIFYGPSSRAFTNSVTFGNVTNGTFQVAGGTNYFFAIIATNEVGISPWSPEIAAFIPKDGAPPAPLLEQNTVTISWDTSDVWTSTNLADWIWLTNSANYLQLPIDRAGDSHFYIVQPRTRIGLTP